MTNNAVQYIMISKYATHFFQLSKFLIPPKYSHLQLEKNKQDIDSQ